MNIAIFASGNGSNAEKIIEHFQNHSKIKIALVLSNKKEAFVLQRAEKHNIPTFTFTLSELNHTNNVIEKLNEYKIGFIVLAGFMVKIPNLLIKAYSGRIINIHPALLPKYGGKGMYGAHVHQAVINAKEQESGITIHYVNEHYDEGQIIFQAKCKISPNDTPESLAQKIHELEHTYYPQITEKVILKEF